MPQLGVADRLLEVRFDPFVVLLFKIVVEVRTRDRQQRRDHHSIPRLETETRDRVNTRIVEIRAGRRQELRRPALGDREVLPRESLSFHVDEQSLPTRATSYSNCGAVIPRRPWLPRGTGSRE